MASVCPEMVSKNENGSPRLSIFLKLPKNKNKRFVKKMDRKR
jgi:hypothetical protein